MLDLMTSAKFSIIIEEAVKEHRLSYMDAIIWWCEQHEMEIEVAAKLCNGVIKEKLRYEAQELNFLERPNRLPI
ncbi:MAG: late promoter transcription accessory protein [Candidatus Poseidoniales archaeon]